MSEFANAPMVITIVAGDAVRWVNEGAMDHNARSGIDPVEDGLWGSPDVKPGASWTMTFAASGTYDYFCPLHPLLMSGTVVVEP